MEDSKKESSSLDIDSPSPASPGYRLGDGTASGLSWDSITTTTNPPGFGNLVVADTSLELQPVMKLPDPLQSMGLLLRDIQTVPLCLLTAHLLTCTTNCQHLDLST